MPPPQAASAPAPQASVSVPPPFLSIILRAWNLENIIPATLDALAGQTDRGFEVIVVDDGSTDATVDVCERRRSDLPSLTIISQPHGGTAAASLTGSTAARGAWVWFIDGDDLIPAHAVARLREVAIQYGDGGTALKAGVRGCDMIHLEMQRLEHGDFSRASMHPPTDITLVHGPDYLDEVVERALSTHQIEFVISRTLLTRLIPTAFSVGLPHFEDKFFVMTALAQTGTIVFIPDILYTYCIRSGSVTQKSNAADLRAATVLLERLDHLVPPTSDRHTWVLSQLDLALHLWRLGRVLDRGTRRVLLAEVRRRARAAGSRAMGRRRRLQYLAAVTGTWRLQTLARRRRR